MSANIGPVTASDLACSTSQLASGFLCYPVNPESLSLNHLTYFPSSSDNYPPDQTLQTSLSLHLPCTWDSPPDVLSQQAQPHSGSGGFVPSSDPERSSNTSSWRPKAGEGSAVQVQGGHLVLNLRFVVLAGATHAPLAT